MAAREARPDGLTVVAGWLAAVGTACLLGLAVLPVGLILHEDVAWPLALGVAAAFAGLAAWAAGAARGWSVPLWPAVGAAELGAAFAALLYWSLLGALPRAALPNNAASMLVYLLLIGTVAALAVGRLSPVDPPRRQAGAALAVALLAVLAIPVAVAVAALFGLTGA